MRNRKGLPKEVRGSAFKLAANEVRAWRNEKNLVVAWCHKNKKPVVMIGTAFLARPTQPLTGRWRLPITKPEVVVRYNNAMGAVDRTDQYCVYYSFTRRCLKWSRSVVLGN